MPTDDLLLGAVGKPHGLGGDVYVWLDVDLRDALTVGLPCVVGGVATAVERLRDHRGRPLVKFVAVDDRAAAELLRGAEIRVDPGSVDRPDDAYPVADLVGRRVVDADGARVGRVTGALDGAAHDFLVVDVAGGDVLIPVVDALVTLGDPVVVHGPPGLLDPREALE